MVFHGGRGPRRHTRGQPGRAPRVGGEAIKRSCRGPETTEVWSKAASGLMLARATVGLATRARRWLVPTEIRQAWVAILHFAFPGTWVLIRAQVSGK